MFFSQALERAAIVTALIGVSALSVADIHCR
ncbi:Ms4533A family Cys-rich leader peptide [Streptomyces odontomachi]